MTAAFLTLIILSTLCVALAWTMWRARTKDDEERKRGDEVGSLYRAHREQDEATPLKRFSEYLLQQRDEARAERDKMAKQMELARVERAQWEKTACQLGEEVNRLRKDLQWKADALAEQDKVARERCHHEVGVTGCTLTVCTIQSSFPGIVSLYGVKCTNCKKEWAI